MEHLKALEEILAKPNKGESKADRETAVKILYEIFKVEKDCTFVAKYLSQLESKICQCFFDKICLTTSDEDIIRMAEHLVNDEFFQSKNPVHSMYPKGFPVVLALARKNKHQAAFIVLGAILSQSEKAGNFSEGCINNFNKFITQKDGLPFVLDIFDKVESGNIPCTDFAKAQFARFLRTAEASSVKIISSEPPVSMQNSMPPKKEEASVEDANIGVSSLKKCDESANSEALKNIEKFQSDILSTLRTLADNRSTIESLASALQSKDSELSVIRADSADKERNNGLLVVEINEKNKKIDDLTERLKTALQMDNISKSQEITTLKNDISEALKLEYSDYTKSKERPHNEDLFEAYQAMLSRIFKVLKRFGIPCE